MTILWTPRALDDLDAVSEFIARGSPDSANRVSTRITGTVTGLASTPHIGRKGAVSGTRELVFPPWPYIAVYKVQADSIRILRIRHASRQYP